MPKIKPPRVKPRLALAVAALWLAAAGRAPADTILYTASTDNSGFGGDPSVPASNNPFLDGMAAGPINGITYGPNAFGANAGGTTGFVHVTYTIPAIGLYRLIWEVSDVIDHSRPSALAIDNVKLNNTVQFGFESGIPAGFTSLGTVGTSAAVADLAPTQGTRFAFLDTTGNVAPIYDTVDGTFGSRLISSSFSTPAVNTVLSLDLAFLTNDGGPFHDYGIAVLQPASVPEPGTLTSSLIAAAVGLARYAGLRLRRRKRCLVVVAIPVDNRWGIVPRRG